MDCTAVCGGSDQQNTSIFGKQSWESRYFKHLLHPCSVVIGSGFSSIGSCENIVNFLICTTAKMMGFLLSSYWEGCYRPEQSGEHVLHELQHPVCQQHPAPDALLHLREAPLRAQQVILGGEQWIFGCWNISSGAVCFCKLKFSVKEWFKFSVSSSAADTALEVWKYKLLFLGAGNLSASLFISRLELGLNVNLVLIPLWFPGQIP